MERLFHANGKKFLPGALPSLHPTPHLDHHLWWVFFCRLSCSFACYAYFPGNLVTLWSMFTREADLLSPESTGFKSILGLNALRGGSFPCPFNSRSSLLTPPQWSNLYQSTEENNNNEKEGGKTKQTRHSPFRAMEYGPPFVPVSALQIPQYLFPSAY